MEALRNKGVALLLCLLMIAGSSLAGTGASLRRLRSQTEDVFVQGSDGDGMGIQYDLRELATHSYNVTVVAQRYLSQADAPVADVLARRDALNAAVTPREKYRAAQELATAAWLLSAALEAGEPAPQDRELLSKTMINLDNTMGLLAGNDYNAYATYFNRTLESFPASVLGPITGVRPLELYE